MTIVDHHDDAADTATSTTTSTRTRFSLTGTRAAGDAPTVVDIADTTEADAADVGQTPAARTPGTRTARAVRISVVVAAAALLALIAAAAAFAAGGGHWYVVRTPSMGTAAPVGSLVLTRPTTVADLHVGDVVAFHPVGASQLTYTHRVVAISQGSGDSTAAAFVTTRGDINGSADPWRTTDRQLIGKATVLAPGVGYLARALPLMLIGGLLVVAFTRWWLRPDRRGPVRLIGFTLLYTAASLAIRPFVGLRQLATTTTADGGSITAVSTGLLPIRVAALPGHGHAVPVHLGYGQVGTVHLADPPADGKFALVAQLDLPWTLWLALAAIWSAPLLWVLVVGFPREPFPTFVAGLADPPRVTAAATSSSSA